MTKAPQQIQEERQNTPINESYYEHENTLSYLLGKSAGVGEFERQLREQAGVAFTRDQDDLAHTYRAMADEAHSFSLQLRKEWVSAHRCQAGKDGECNWHECPQARDGEPAKSGRACPLLANRHQED